MKTKSLVIASLVAASLMAGGTAAAAKHHGPQNGAYYDYAKVVRVTPVTRIVETSRPERECWHEEVVRQARSDANLGGLVLGGVVGGVIGNRFGGGNGKKIATVAGSIAGAALGQEMTRRPGHSYTTYEECCRTYRVSHTEERVIGYDVVYRYNGQEYVTRTDRDPGSRIRVRVSVTPAG